MSIESRKYQYGKVFGHWQIKEFLGSGSGGKSAVFRLEHTESKGVESALKVISLIEERGRFEALSEQRRHDYTMARKDCSDRAEGEVLLMNDLQGNTNIVDYMDHTFVDWSDDNGFGRDMLIRMEKLTDLRGEINREKQFSREELLKIGRDICTALILCHKNGILHRDIKPENIFINKNSNYKLGDFGVSRIVNSSSSGFASTGIGTPQYWAPEQTSGNYDVRVDIYSLGLVLYELANRNRLPFAQSSYVSERDIHRRLLGEALPAPAGADAALAEVILTACAHRPEDRYQTAGEFLQALNQLSHPGFAAGYNTVQAQGDAPRQTYRTMPAQDNASRQTYRTVPAQDDASRQIYRTVPAQDDASRQTYRTMPAQDDASRQIYRTVPAQDDASRQTYRTMPAQETYPPASTPGAAANSESGSRIKVLPLALGVLAVLLCAFLWLNPKAEDESAETTANNEQTTQTTQSAPETQLPVETDPPIETTTVPDELTLMKQALADAQVGDVITFGTFEQDNDFSNGNEPIEWIVLDKTDDRIFVISRYALDNQSFHTQLTAVTWENCYLRQWLNESFFYSAFTADEQSLIPTVTVSAEYNPQHSHDPGNDTQDKVYIPSILEVQKYFPDKQSRCCYATQYAMSRGQTWVEYGTGCIWWWLRNPGEYSTDATTVNTDGSIDFEDGMVNSVTGTVRPVMWISFD